MGVADVTNGLVRLLLDPRCPGCRRPLTHPLDRCICEDCWTSVKPIEGPLCVRCGDRIPIASEGGRCNRCRVRPPGFSIAQSAGEYNGPLRELLHAFKFQNRRQLAEPLARLMCRRGLNVLAGADAVVPVPLHPVRLFTRGFNQADDLAREVGLPVWRLLRRRKYGVPQASLSAVRRRSNLRRGYAGNLRAMLPRPLGPQFSDATVVLIDDIMTTGATLDACAQTLLNLGVRDVRALTVARSLSKRQHPRHEQRRALPPRHQ